MAKAKRGYKVVKIEPKGAKQITLRTSSAVQNAYKHLRESEDLSVYDFTRVLTLIYASYAQGKKDGARAVFDRIDEDLAAAKADIPHRLPGRPRA